MTDYLVKCVDRASGGDPQHCHIYQAFVRPVTGGMGRLLPVKIFDGKSSLVTITSFPRTTRADGPSSNGTNANVASRPFVRNQTIFKTTISPRRAPVHREPSRTTPVVQCDERRTMTTWAAGEPYG